MKKIILIILLNLYVADCMAQVGINTNNPQADLHVTGSSSNIRIEGLSTSGNANNLGASFTARVNGNGNVDIVLGVASEKAALLVDTENYLNDVESPTSFINQTGIAFGYDAPGAPADMVAAIFTHTLSSIINAKYSLTWLV